MPGKSRSPVIDSNCSIADASDLTSAPRVECLLNCGCIDGDCHSFTLGMTGTGVCKAEISLKLKNGAFP